MQQHPNKLKLVKIPISLSPAPPNLPIQIFDYKLQLIHQTLPKFATDTHIKNTNQQVFIMLMYLQLRNVFTCISYVLYPDVYFGKCLSCPNVAIKRFNNVNKSCQVIMGNPPIDQGLKSPQLRVTSVIRLT